MKKILIISNSTLESDPRVYKQIKYLKERGYYVVTAGKSLSGIEDLFIDIILKDKSIYNFMDFVRKPSKEIFKYIANKHIKLFLSILKSSKLLLKFGCYNTYFQNTYCGINSISRFEKHAIAFDLIIANDIPALPLALKLAGKNNSKIYIDAHEYEPLHYNSFEFNFFYKNYWNYICKKYLPKVDYMTTVCDGIAEAYSSNFNVKCEVMMNLPFYCDIKPSKCVKNKIRIIHHGLASSGRQLENMIELMDYLNDRFELHFMLTNMNSQYGNELKKLASKNNRIRFLPPVKMMEIPEFISEYDVGLYLLVPNTFNQRMALPNKIFEFIQGRLAVAIWPSQEMVKIVDKYEIGVYSHNFDVKEMADVLNGLTEKDINKMKKNSDIAAKKLNSEQNRKQLYKIVKDLIG